MADPQLFLVAKVLDTSYGVVDGVKVFASFDGKDKIQMTPGSFGTHSLPFITAATKVRITIDHPGFVSIDQTLKVDRQAFTLAFDNPASNPEGPQDINVRNVAAHNRDSNDGINLEVYPILNRLFDGESRVNGVNFTGKADLSLKNKGISLIKTPILDPGPNAVILSIPENVTPKGKVFFAQRVTDTAPKLLAIFVPQNIIDSLKNQSRDKAAITLPYHLFFPPLIAGDQANPKKFSGDYPLSQDYVNHVEKYMFLEVTSGAGEAFMGKTLINQSERGAKHPILIFPVGGLKAQLGDLPTPQNIRNLLLDINYWIQRMLKVSFPLVPAPIGKLALSAFSAGIRNMVPLFATLAANSPDVSAQRVFLDDILKELYVFDGVFAGPTGKAETQDFCRAVLKKWFSGGKDSRVLRVYTQSGQWMDELGTAIAAKPTVTGPFGSKEIEGPSGTVLLIPRDFWRNLLFKQDPGFETRSKSIAAKAAGKLLAAGKITKEQVPAETEKALNAIIYKVGHQMIPAKFCEHAVTNSKM